MWTKTMRESIVRLIGKKFGKSEILKKKNFSKIIKYYGNQRKKLGEIFIGVFQIKMFSILQLLIVQGMEYLEQWFP